MHAAALRKSAAIARVAARGGAFGSGGTGLSGSGDIAAAAIAVAERRARGLQTRTAGDQFKGCGTAALYLLDTARHGAVRLHPSPRGVAARPERTVDGGCFCGKIALLSAFFPGRRSLTIRT